MTLLELSEIFGNFGEFVGAIAVVVTLVYLTLQIKQNTNATMAQIYQARSDSGQQQALVIAQSTELSAIMKKMRSDEGFVDTSKLELLDEAEMEQLRWLQTSFRARIDNVFYQHQQGFLDKEFYEDQFESTVPILAPLWQELGIGFGRASFNREIERILVESD